MKKMGFTDEMIKENLHPLSESDKSSPISKVVKIGENLPFSQSHPSIIPKNSNKDDFPPPSSSSKGPENKGNTLDFQRQTRDQLLFSFRSPKCFEERYVYLFEFLFDEIMY